MKTIRTSAVALLGAVKLANSVIKGNNMLPVLDYLKLEAKGGQLDVTGSDLETTIIASCSCEGDECTILVPAGQLLKILVAVGSTPIAFNSEEGKIDIVTDNGKFSISGSDIEAYPVSPNGGEVLIFSMEGDEYREAVNSVAFCCGHDEMRPVFGGVCFDLQGGRLVCTDATKLAIRQTTFAGVGDDYPTFIMEGTIATLSAKQKAKEVKIGLMMEGEGETKAVTHITLSFPGVTIITRAIDGKYPNIDAVVPSKENAVNFFLFERDKFTKDIKTASIMANSTTHGIILNFGTESTIEANDYDFGHGTKQRIGGQYGGDPDFRISFNSEYLGAIVSNSDETATLEMSANNKAAVIRNKKTLYLVMPIMIVEAPDPKNEEEPIEEEEMEEAEA